MDKYDVSVIMPLNNIAPYVRRIIDNICSSFPAERMELIAVDMGSTDSTVFNAFSFIREKGINGCVVQSGSGEIGGALNSGLYRAAGKYVIFIFPRKLYTGFLLDFFNEAVKNQADFVFGLPQETTQENNIVVGKIEGEELFLGIIQGAVNIDAAAVLISRSFLMKHSIRFSENCKLGYTEEFIYNVLINSAKAVQCSCTAKRNTELEAPKHGSEPKGSMCFDRIEAMLRIFENLNCKNNKKLIEVFQGEKLPKTVLLCIDTLLNEGYSVNAVKNALKVKHYDRLLKINKYTSITVAKKIMLWRHMPWSFKK